MHPGLSQEQFITILRAALTKINEDVGENFLKARLLGIILSALHYRPKQTCEFLKGEGLLDGMIKTIIERTYFFDESYDRKLLILGMLSLLKLICNEGINQTNKQLVADILTSIVHNLMIERMKRNKYHLKKASRYPTHKQDIEIYKNLRMIYAQKAEVPLDQIDEEDDEDMDNDIFAYLLKNSNQSRLPLVNLETPIQVIDEFKEFNDIFGVIRVIYFFYFLEWTR